MPKPDETTKVSTEIQPSSIDDLCGDYDEKSREEDRRSMEDSFVRTFKSKRTILRVLPPPKGQTKPFRKFKRHYVKVPGLPIMRVACPRNENRVCGLCDLGDTFQAKYDKDGNELDEKIAYELRGKDNGICNAIDRADKEPTVFIQIMPPKILKRFQDILDDKDAGGYYLSPMNGFDLIVDKEGQGARGKNKTEYTVTPLRKNSNAMLAPTEEQVRALLLARHNLDEFIIPPPSDKLSKFADLVYSAIKGGKPLNAYDDKNVVGQAVDQGRRGQLDQRPREGDGYYSQEPPRQRSQPQRSAGRVIDQPTRQLPEQQQDLHYDGQDNYRDEPPPPPPQRAARPPREERYADERQPPRRHAEQSAQGYYEREQPRPASQQGRRGPPPPPPPADEDDGLDPRWQDER